MIQFILVVVGEEVWPELVWWSEWKHTPDASNKLEYGKNKIVLEAVNFDYILFQLDIVKRLIKEGADVGLV